MAISDLSALTDADLLLAYAAEFSEASFTALFVRHQARLVKYLREAFRFDEPTALDVAQDAWLRLATHSRDGIEQPWAWLREAAHRLALSCIRQASRINATGLTCDVADGQAVQPISQAIATEENDLARGRLAQLQDDEAAALRMIYADGLTIAEAAQRLGMPASTLSYRLRRAAKRIACAA